MPAAAQLAGLVEVNVGIDEAGQDEPAFEVDLNRVGLKPRFDRGKFALGYADIHGAGRRAHQRIAEDQVEGGSRRHGTSIFGVSVQRNAARGGSGSAAV